MNEEQWKSRRAWMLRYRLLNQATVEGTAAFEAEEWDLRLEGAKLWETINKKQSKDRFLR